MKSGWVLLSIFAGVIVSSILHHYKNSQITDDAARIETAIKAVQKIYPNNNRMGLVTIPANAEVISLTRFALAPVAASLGTSDTTLYITINDSASAVSQKHTLWQQADDKYTYTLTTAR